MLHKRSIKFKDACAGLLAVVHAKDRAAMDAPLWKAHVEQIVQSRAQMLMERARSAYVYEDIEAHKAAEEFSSYRK